MIDLSRRSAADSFALLLAYDRRGCTPRVFTIHLCLLGVQTSGFDKLLWAFSFQFIITCYHAYGAMMTELESM
jgi:hypothetical protein